MPLRKQVGYVGLKNLSYDIVDSDIISRDYFNIVQFPDRFTAGKNLFKIKANARNLVDQSTIHIEILDYNGNPIYYEPINYIEKDGTRVIAVYIYPDTSPGTCTVYIAGRARTDIRTGRVLSYSRDVNSPDYYNSPNLLWKRDVTVAPFARNNTEIIFTQFPKITVSEVVQPYLQPVDLFNVFTVMTGSGGSLTISPLPQYTPYVVGSDVGSQTNEGGGSAGTPNFGLQFFDISVLNNSLIGSQNQSALTPPLYTLQGASKLTTTNFPLSASMVGGVLEIVQPNIIAVSSDPVTTFKQSVANLFVPESQINDPNDFPIGSPYTVVGNNTSGQLSGSLKFAIVNVLSSNTAWVAQFGGFKNNIDNTYGPFAVKLATETGVADLTTNIQSSTNFTASFIQPVITTVTERSSSFADLIVSDIEPATGDVYKIKTLYKPSGFFGDFIDLGDTILEQTPILIDTGSYETNISVGTAYENFGYFENLEEILTYWTSSSLGNVDPNPLTITYDVDTLIGGARLLTNYSPGNQYVADVDDAIIFHIKPQFLPMVYEDTEYIVRFKVANDSTAALYSSNDLNIPNARLDVYISGSMVETQERYKFASAGEIYYVENFNATLLNNFQDNGILGSRIGTYQVKPIPGALGFVEFRFRAKESKPVDLKFVMRNGSFIISEIELLANKETGFSPNYTRIFKRIPTEHLNTPLTFKFQYFDYEGRKADLENIVYGAIFSGDNTYIQGTNNLITGSIFVSDAIGTGLEIAGYNSGFIRTVGFKGIQKALLGTGSTAGFIMYSGSVIPSETTEFSGGGSGFQIMASPSRYLGVSSVTDEIAIKTPGFKFVNNNSGDNYSEITGSFGVSGSYRLNGNTLFNYGAFSDTTDQTTAANVTASMTYNTTDVADGVTLISGSQLVMPSTGIYNIQFSAQLLARSGADTVFIWLKKNGVNVDNSATAVFLENNQEYVAAWNWVYPFNNNDYAEIVWTAESGNTYIEHFPTSGSIPAIPSVIVTVTQIA